MLKYVDVFYKDQYHRMVWDESLRTNKQKCLQMEIKYP